MKSQEPAAPESTRGADQYSIHGINLEINCDHEEVRGRLHDLFQVYSTPDAPAGEKPGISLELGLSDRIYPVPLYSRLLFIYGPVRCYFLDGRYYFTDYFSTIALEPEAGRLHGNLSPETLKDYGVNVFVGLLFLLSFFEALRFKGLYFIHAAAVQGPDDTGYLVVGQAGSGKTTLTLSLINAGFAFLSDDTVFARPGEDGNVEVLGFAREFHVARDLIDDEESLKHLSALPDFCTRRHRKLLKPQEWFPQQRRDRILNPRVILLPSLDGQGSSLELVSPAETFSELLRQSPYAAFNQSLSAGHLHALKLLVRHGQGIRLRAGPEIKGNPQAARDLLERARDLAQKSGSGK